MESVGWKKCYHVTECVKAICGICQNEGIESCYDKYIVCPEVYHEFKEEIDPPVQMLSESILKTPIPERKQEDNYSRGWSIGDGGFKTWNYPNM